MPPLMVVQTLAESSFATLSDIKVCGAQVLCLHRSHFVSLINYEFGCIWLHIVAMTIAYQHRIQSG